MLSTRGRKLWQRLPLRQAILPLLAVVGATILSGCATSGSSDMPWNVPQTWEGSPMVPGFQKP